MSSLLRLSEQWFRLLVRLYPHDFRDEMGDALIQTYMDRAHDAAANGGASAVLLLWFRALGDAVRNGVGERFSPAASWRRAGQWGRDVDSCRGA